MRRLIYALFALLMLNANTSFGQEPDYLQIKIVKIGGRYWYSTPYFSICPSINSLKGKIVYFSNQREGSCFFIIFLQDSENELISQLKRMTIENSENYLLKIVAEPESFVIRIPKIFGCVGEDLDPKEEYRIIFIRIEESLCTKDNQDKNNFETTDFKKLITKSKFKKIHIEYNGETIDIPLEFPLDKIIRKMEREKKYLLNVGRKILGL